MGRTPRVGWACLCATVVLTSSAGCSNTNVLYETTAGAYGSLQLETNVSTAARLTAGKLLVVAQGETWYRTYYAPPPGPRFAGYVGYGHGHRSGWYGGGRYYSAWPYPYWDYPPYAPYVVSIYEVYLTLTVEEFPQPGEKLAVRPEQVSVAVGEFLAPRTFARMQLAVESATAYWHKGKPVVEFEARAVLTDPDSPPANDGAAGSPPGGTMVTIVRAPSRFRAKVKGDLSAESWTRVTGRFRAAGVATAMNVPAE